MKTNVVMPQMGESVTEGMLTIWLKEIGDRVERDEPLFEITTDKVDVELDGDKVLVTFKVGSDVSLGDRSEAAVKTNLPVLELQASCIRASSFLL